MPEALIPHLTEVKVRGYHLDLCGTFTTRGTWRFLEEAAWRCIEKYGSIQFLVNAKLAFVIVSININYRTAATSGEELVIETAMKSIGTRSAIMRHALKLKRTTSVIADADLIFVIAGGGAGGAVALEGALRAMFQNMLFVSERTADAGWTQASCDCSPSPGLPCSEDSCFPSELSAQA